MEALELMRRRFTTKHYDPTRPVTEKELETLLEVLRLSPTSVNIQPWHFVAVRSAEALAKLLPAVKDFNVARVRDAGCVILFCIRTDIATDAYLDRLGAQEAADGRGRSDEADALRRASVRNYCRTPESGERWASEQAHIALGCALAAAARMGVATTVLGGMRFDDINRIFGFPEKHLKCVMGLAVGHGAADDANAARPKSRFPTEAVVSRI